MIFKSPKTIHKLSLAAKLLVTLLLCASAAPSQQPSPDTIKVEARVHTVLEGGNHPYTHKRANSEEPGLKNRDQTGQRDHQAESTHEELGEGVGSSL